MTLVDRSMFSRRSLLIATQLSIVGAILIATYLFISPADDVQANDAEFEEALHRINAYRAWIGIKPLEMHPALMEAAQSHADYYELNNGNMPGLHNQTPGAPGFTGATMRDRAVNFGYPVGSINENVGLSGSMVATVHWSIATISHRQTLLDPRYEHIGFGAVGNMETIKLGTPNWSHTAEPDWQAWPVDGTSNVGLTMLGGIPGSFSGVSTPAGYPITLKYHGGGTVQFHEASLQANGTDVPMHYAAGSGWLSRNTMMIMAANPLQPLTQYHVTVQASVDGQSVTHSWTFQTGASDASTPTHDGNAPAPPPPPPSEPEPVIPGQLESASPAFQRTWEDADGPVFLDEINRSWLWGPDAFSIRTEHYSNSPDAQRDVAYFDKSRMEVNDPNGDEASQWFVTNGLLVREMIGGVVQLGDDEFEQHESAQIAIAGDHLSINPEAPTYGSLRPHSDLIEENRQPDRTGEAVKTRLTARGRVLHGPEMPDGVTYAHYDDTTGFNVADVFWNEFNNAEHYDWIYAVGHPISDPHWVYTSVDGVNQWVLVQAFQRRLLTFTPGNDPGWQIEMGNVGRHYYTWRYGEAPPN
jgi:uncharacterized protein YkwD